MSLHLDPHVSKTLKQLGLVPQSKGPALPGLGVVSSRKQVVAEASLVLHSNDSGLWEARRILTLPLKIDGGGHWRGSARIELEKVRIGFYFIQKFTSPCWFVG